MDSYKYRYYHAPLNFIACNAYQFELKVKNKNKKMIQKWTKAKGIPKKQHKYKYVYTCAEQII